MNQTKDAAQIDWSRFDEKSFESLMAASKHGLSYADLKDSPVNFHLGQVTFKDTTFDFQFVPRGILCQSNHPTLGSWYLSDDSWISTNG